jgi:hypothetical protein
VPHTCIFIVILIIIIVFEMEGGEGKVEGVDGGGE